MQNIFLNIFNIHFYLIHVHVCYSMSLICIIHTLFTLKKIRSHHLGYVCEWVFFFFFFVCGHLISVHIVIWFSTTYLALNTSYVLFIIPGTFLLLIVTKRNISYIPEGWGVESWHESYWSYSVIVFTALVAAALNRWHRLLGERRLHSESLRNPWVLVRNF